ncbi:hypothetical protein Tco_1036949, partial [Tanacetum coccineum]
LRCRHLPKVESVVITLVSPLETEVKGSILTPCKAKGPFLPSLREKGEQVTEFFPGTFVAGEESLNDKNGSYVAPILKDFLVKEFRGFPRRHVAGDNVVKV